MAILVSATVLLVTYLVGNFLKKRINRDETGKRRESGLARTLLTDAVLSLELCISSFECGVVLDHYGILCWCAFVFLATAHTTAHWKKYAFPSPTTQIQLCLEGKQSASTAAIRTMVSLASGLLAMRILGAVWDYDLSAHHAGRTIALSAAHCSTPFAGVSVLGAAAAEAAGTMFLAVVGPLITESPTLEARDPALAVVLHAAIVVGAILAAFDVSGGMFNPMLATTLLGGCSGHSAWQHFAVYWLGGAAGVTLAHLVNRSMHGSQEKPKQA